MRALVCVLALAGCDRVFGIGDPYQDARGGSSEAGIDAGPPDAPTVLAPISYFPFDENLTDSVSHVAAACVGGGGCAYVTPGKRGNGAVVLQGSSCVSFLLAEMPAHFSIAMWVFPSVNGQSTVFERSMSSVASPTGWKLEATQADFIFTTYNGTTSDAATSQHGAPVGTWTHVAVTFDGTSKRIYVNGILERTTPAVVVTPTYTMATIGCTEATTSKLQGTVDEAYVYGAALTDADVLALSSP